MSAIATPANAPASSASGYGVVEEFDFHHAITKKERSSRYLRTAIDYFTRVKGKEACDSFLNRIGINRESSIFKHIYDDENWNSYALEVYLYDQLKDEFEDPYQAIWEFGMASGSGELDQKDTLFAFKVKVAPVPVLVKKASEHTERMSLISECHAGLIPKSEIKSRGKKGARLHFNYTRLPEGFDYPHWTSIVAGYGIVYGLFAHRKGLKEMTLSITHWPNLPSDLPSVNGKHYSFDKVTKNIIEDESGEVIANAKDGPFELDGIVFNNNFEAVCAFEYRPESLGKRIARNTFQRGKIKREQKLREMRDDIIRELSVEHQAQLGRYEKELSEKMAEIQALKVQQDGDYFLTSLLTKPLIVNRNRSETINSEFVVHQKKRFEFRNRESELGGDICVVNNVELQGRRYTAFVNGDAMGKSMQGAGGALVLGVVYNAFVSRSLFSAHQQKKDPEVWLRDCYYELQNVFISFDGSMYISVVMGLLDEVNGMMYYINAEHPSTVLFRGGKASFLEDELLLRKIGTPGEEDHILIRTFQLEPGDAIIAGSDGRDDLEIGFDEESSSRIINEDEEAFLTRVEESGGNLESIVDCLRKHGKFTDDLSLLKISYRSDETPVEPGVDETLKESLRQATALIRDGQPEEALVHLDQLHKQYPDRYEILRYLGRVQFKLKKYAEALETLQRYFHEQPLDTEVAHLISVSGKLLKKYDIAIAFGEKVILRDPGEVKYLISLADAYRITGNLERARELNQMAIRLQGGNPQVQRLTDLLSEARS